MKITLRAGEKVLFTAEAGRDGLVTEGNRVVTDGEWCGAAGDSTMETERTERRCDVSVGERIKEVRVRAGLPQEAFAEKLGVSRSAVAKWETDPESMPDVANLIAIAETFDVSVDELLQVRRKGEGTLSGRAPKLIIEVSYE